MRTQAAVLGPTPLYFRSSSLISSSERLLKCSRVHSPDSATVLSKMLCKFHWYVCSSLELHHRVTTACKSTSERFHTQQILLQMPKHINYLEAELGRQQVIICSEVLLWSLKIPLQGMPSESGSNYFISLAYLDSLCLDCCQSPKLYGSFHFSCTDFAQLDVYGSRASECFRIAPDCHWARLYGLTFYTDQSDCYCFHILGEKRHLCVLPTCRIVVHVKWKRKRARDTWRGTSDFLPLWEGCFEVSKGSVRIAVSCILWQYGLHLQ